MKNHCTVCDGQLDIWERLWGRFDHPACRSGNTAVPPAPPGPYPQAVVPAKTALPIRLRIGLRTLQVFAALREHGYAARGRFAADGIEGPVPPEVV